MSLYHSPSSILLFLPCLFLSSSGEPCSAAKKKNIIRLHLTSYVEFCSCVTLDDKGAESKCPSCYVIFFIYIYLICFVCLVVYVGIWLF